MAIEVRYVTPAGVETGTADEIATLRKRDDGFLWVDFPACDDGVADLLLHEFDFHPRAVEACQRRAHMPTFHGYDDHWFVVVHRPLWGTAGHVHLLQLELFIGADYVLTLHGPYNPEIDAEAVGEDTRGVRTRLDAGRFRPDSPSELAHGVIAALAREYRDHLGTIATKVAELERHVVGDDLRRPERLLDRMFLVRHELITVRTMAAHAHEMLGRMATITTSLPFEDRSLLGDLSDRFSRLRTMADGEREFLAGVIDYYQTRTTTKMTLATERLAVLAAITLPVTALASVYGMNVIVNDRTNVAQLVIALAVMAAISLLLLRWARRQGWW
jgi:Mg2+ and Co2+ transporter CorA